jgi:hypothetical protein
MDGKALVKLLKIRFRCPVIYSVDKIKSGYYRET